MSKVELAGLDGLIERLRKSSWRFVSRKGFHGQERYFINPDGPTASVKLEALRDCARELAGFAWHTSFCELGAWHGQSLIAEKEGIRCTCGLDEALASFREVGEG